MLKLSEELEQLSACDDHSSVLYGIPERAAALEIELEALKAERATILSENEALKNARNRDGILKERDHWSRRAEKAETELEAGQKQEPAVLIEGKKIFWNPEYKGVHEGGFYASPVPAQPGHVQMPTNADEAAAMHMVGLAWLERNAPERLKEEKNKIFVYDWIKGVEFFDSKDEAMQSFDERIELQKTTPGGDASDVCWGVVKSGGPCINRIG